LGVGEALVSMLDDKGSPNMVERTLIAPPQSRVGPITPQERQATIDASALKGKYDTAIDRESAFEILQKRSGDRSLNAGAPTAPGQQPQEASAGGGILGEIGGMLGGILGGGSTSATGKRQRMSTGEMIVRSAAQSAARSVGTTLTRAILRGVLGGMSR
ncbi:MAG: DUF853 family protein, partial [Hyphomicrobiales bacterium]|nr:DUF853 family protein [Hyphomicrobiales bacterium]